MAAVVVAAVAHHEGELVGVAIRAHEVIAGSLAGAVWALRIVGRFFSEEAAIVQRAIDLVRAHVVEALPFESAIPPFTGCVQQSHRAQHIGLNERQRIADAAIHVTFCGEMDDAIGLVLREDLHQPFRIADVALHEGVVRCVLHVAQVLQVPGVGERIQIDDPVVRVFVHETPHHMAADETGTDRDQYGALAAHRLRYVRLFTVFR